MSKGLFAQLEGCLGLLGVIIIILHLLLAQYFKQSIVDIVSFPVEIPLWQSEKHHQAINDVFFTLGHQLRLHFPPLVFVAVLDGCTVRTS
jgi:hypothetical protein